MIYELISKFQNYPWTIIPIGFRNLDWRCCSWRIGSIIKMVLYVL